MAAPLSDQLLGILCNIGEQGAAATTATLSLTFTRYDILSAQPALLNAKANPDEATGSSSGSKATAGNSISVTASATA